MRTLDWRSPAIVLVPIMAAIAAAQPADGSPPKRTLTFGEPTTLLASREFNFLGEVAIGADGSAYLLDVSNVAIIKIDSSGRFIWSVGRKGAGPGEFRVPYQIAARPEGGVAVLDWGLGRITELTADGKIVRTLHVPFTFSQIDGLEILGDGRVVIAGTTRSSPAAAAHSVHVFDDSVRYLTSFGSLPASPDSTSAREVGAGGIQLDSQGRILFTPKRPFAVYRFAATGEPASPPVSVNIPLEYTLSDFIEVTQVNGRTVKSLTPRSKFVEVPVPVVELPEGGFLGGRATWESVKIDLISPAGELESSVERPAGCVQVLAFDAERRWLYCKALRDDVPVFQRLPFTVSR